MRTLFYSFVIGLLLVSAFGCAQNTEPIAQQTSAVAQELPQETENDVRNIYLINGHVPRDLITALNEGNVGYESVPPLPATASITLPLDDGTDDVELVKATGASATHTMNVNLVFRAWGDSSQDGQAEGSQVQETAAEFTVRTVIELMYQNQKALLAQMSGTSGQAVESSTADTTGGALNLDAKLDAVIELLNDLKVSLTPLIGG